MSETTKREAALVVLEEVLLAAPKRYRVIDRLMKEDDYSG